MALKFHAKYGTTPTMFIDGADLATGTPILVCYGTLYFKLMRLRQVLFPAIAISNTFHCVNY